MQPAVTLRYARVRKKWTRRRIILVTVLIVVAGVAGHGGYRLYEVVRARVKLLNSQPRLGPIDWWTVVRSPALRALAWELSSDPRTIRRFVTAPNGVAGVALFGADPDDVKIDLEFPLSYVDGELRLRLRLGNVGARTVLIPARLRRRVYRSQDNERDQTMSILLVGEYGAGEWFSTGVRVLEPGTTTSLELRCRVPQAPVPTLVVIHTPARGLWFCDVLTGIRWLAATCKSWDQVPRSAARGEWLGRWRKRSAPDGTFPSNGPALPPVLFADELRKRFPTNEHVP